MAHAPARRMTDAQLHALLAVADTGSFTLAARRLGLTQSAVSHALGVLEKSLRVSLVERDPREARLTPVGRQVAEHAREVLRLKARMRQDAEDARRLHHGLLRVGSFGVSSSRRLLPPLLDAFTALHPKVAIEIREGADDEVERWLHDGTIDAGFVTLPADAFDTVIAARDVLQAVVPAGGPLAARRRMPARALGAHPFIMSSGGCETIIRSALCDTVPDVRFHIRETETIVDMVARGMGVSVVPRLALPETVPAGVCFVPLETACVREIGLAVRRQEQAGSPARALQRLVSAPDGAPIGA